MIKIRNFANYLLYGFKNGQLHIFSLIIDLVILYIAVDEFSSEFGEYLNTKPFWFIAVLFLMNIVWQFISIAKDFKEYFFKEYSNENIEKTVDFQNYCNSDQKIETMSNGTFSYNEEICKKLRDDDDFECAVYKPASKKVDNYIKNIFPCLLPFISKHYNDSQSNDKLFTNDKKLCLYGQITMRDNKVHLCKGSYYNTYLTNKIFLKSLISNEASNIYPMHGYSNRKVKLPCEYFSNEIGVSTIAITIDGYLFLQLQGTHADASAGLIVPSGSGSADWNDYTKNKKITSSLEEIISYSTKRELAEETGTQNKDLNRVVSKSKVIGFFRWLNFGGKPEFVSLSILNKNRDDIVPQNSEQQPLSIDYCFKIVTRENTIDDSELERCWKIMEKPNCSLPLYVNLKMLKLYVDNDKDGFERFLGLNNQNP